MMKSKSEIIDALNKCKVEECLCDECSYNGPINCCGKLMEDALALLTRSEFITTLQLIGRSDWVHDLGVEEKSDGGKTIVFATGSNSQYTRLPFDSHGNIRGLEYERAVFLKDPYGQGEANEEQS